MDIGKVFISSILDRKTEDLRAERDAVKTAVDQYEFLKAWTFEDAPASPEELADSYLRHVDECDLFIALVATQMTDPVEAEYYRAKDRGKRILIFVKNVPSRTTRARAFLDGANKRYVTFNAAGDLAKLVREGINQSLVLALRSAQQEAFEEIQDRKRRIQKTVDEYIRNDSRHFTNSFHGLLLADVKGLKSDDEIREAIELIERRTGRHPLGAAMAARLEGLDLKEVFQVLRFDQTRVLNFEEAVKKCGIPPERSR